jgi:hypothetical protein
MRSHTFAHLALVASSLAGCGDNGRMVIQPNLEGQDVEALVGADAARNLALVVPAEQPSPGAATGEPAYSARFVAGGYDRIFIYKADRLSDVCVTLIVRSPAMGGTSNPAMSIELPLRWQVERSMELRGAAACGSWPPVASGILARAGSGRVTWASAGGGHLWCGAGGVDVDVTLTFGANASELPETAILSAKVIPAGC